MWRVGDVKNINVWRDKWIPYLPKGHPTLCGSHLPTFMKVSSLIDVDRREWNETTINEMFQAVEAFEILAIPLSKRFVPDKLI